MSPYSFVGRPIAAHLKSQLHRGYRFRDVKAFASIEDRLDRTIDNKIVLEGIAENREEHERAEAIAQTYARDLFAAPVFERDKSTGAERGRVLNLIEVKSLNSRPRAPAAQASR